MNLIMSILALIGLIAIATVVLFIFCALIISAIGEGIDK